MEHQATIDGAVRRYIAESAEAILACPLDDITVLYHRPSGQTHMVISPVPEIMDALKGAGAVTAGDVHRSLSRRYDLGEGDGAVLEIETHLDSLVALGLARRA